MNIQVFVPGRKKGQHYELAMFAVKKLKRVNLKVKGHSERGFENTITAILQSSPKLNRELIAGIDKDKAEKIAKASLFGFTHRPDLSIGDYGTAIEIKVISSGQSLRDLIGQAITYRMSYRFVILVVVDLTDDCNVVKLCQSKKSNEFKFLSELAKTMNIFTVVGPLGQSKNAVFY